jgi:hypothetical protein
MYPDRRGLRFTFEASAELALKDTPKAIVPGRVTELSLQGCFVETSAAFEAQRLVRVKIYDSHESFEAEAIVLYVRPTGLGLVFREFTPESTAILQKWMIRALDSQMAPL